MSYNVLIQDLAQFLTIKKGLANNTVRLVTSRYALYDSWCEENHNNVLQWSKQNVESYLYTLKQNQLSNNSINSYIFMFRMLHDYFTDRSIDLEDFANGLKSLPKNRPDIEILTPDEIDKILASHMTYGTFRGKCADCLNDIYYRFTFFLASTGCRFSEASGLKVKNVRGDFVIFEETKNHDTRRAYIFGPLKTLVLENCLGKSPEDLVFLGLTGHEIIPQNYNEDLKRRARICGITKNVHPHIFRHSFATLLLCNGIELTSVASLLGHRDIQTTYQNYVHLADETLKKATMRHPLVRMNIEPSEILKMANEAIKNLHFESDTRFAYHLDEGTNSLRFEVFLK